MPLVKQRKFPSGLVVSLTMNRQHHSTHCLYQTLVKNTWALQKSHLLFCPITNLGFMLWVVPSLDKLGRLCQEVRTSYIKSLPNHTCRSPRGANPWFTTLYDTLPPPSSDLQQNKTDLFSVIFNNSNTMYAHSKGGGRQKKRVDFPFLPWNESNVHSGRVT